MTYDPNYVIKRTDATYPALAPTWTVVHNWTNEYLSHHASETEARAAIRRYEAADERRARYNGRLTWKPNQGGPRPFDS